MRYAVIGGWWNGIRQNVMQMVVERRVGDRLGVGGECNVSNRWCELDYDTRFVLLMLTVCVMA